jgi:IS30 family transposase
MYVRLSIPELDDADWLAREYVGNLRPAGEIASELGCSKETIYRHLRRHGIPIRPKRRAMRLARNGVDFDDAAAAAMYQAGASASDIAVRLSASKTTVFGALERQGVKIRSKREAALRRRDTSQRRMPRPSRLVGELSRCAACGTQDSLEVHHVNADCSDGHPNNLMALCWEHHTLVEYLITQALLGIRRREVGGSGFAVLD